jgi:hypothetical protein
VVNGIHIEEDDDESRRYPTEVTRYSYGSIFIR